VRHGLGMSDLVLIFWTWYVVVRMAQWLWSRRKIARRERLAADWPVGSGKVSSGWVLPYASQLTVTYKMALPAYHIDTWKHDFSSKGEAEHAKNLLTGWECPVRYNPACEDQTTLMWADVQARLASVPYVPVVKPLTQAGYRWMMAWVVLGLGGLATCLTVYGIVMAGSSACLCAVFIGLMGGFIVVGPAAATIWSRLAGPVPVGGFLRRMWTVMDVWERWAIGLSLLWAIANLIYWPMMRGVSRGGDLSDRAAVGMLLVPVMSAYLLCGLGAVKALRQRKLVAEAVGSAALA
jgi:hypothetical protein